MFRPQREEVTAKWGKLHNEGRQNIIIPKILRIKIKLSRRDR
jgi:hypothetical protein